MRMNIFAIAGPTALVAALLLTGSAFGAAIVTSFTNRTSFNNATAGPEVVNFNNFQSELSFNNAPLDVGPFTLSADQPQLSRPKLHRHSPSPVWKC